MKKVSFLFSFIFIFISLPSISFGKDLPKIAVWDLAPRNIPVPHAQELTSILVSEISKLEKYEVYSQENVRTLAGWTEERMKLGCSSTQCLTALGQMDVAKLISGSVGKIGNTYSISLNLFDTQNAKAEKAISEFCRTEDELIPLIQQAAGKLLGTRQVISSPPPPVPSPEPAREPIPSQPALSPPPKPMRDEMISAGNWRPSKPLSLVVPFPPGGSTDVLARSAARFGERDIGQPIVVMNRPGKGGAIGASYVAKSQSDGYTLLIGYGAAADLITPHLQKPDYDTFKDLIPVCRLSTNAVALAVRADAPHNTLRKFIEWGANRTVRAGVSGKATPGDIIIRAFGVSSRLRIEPIFFAGDAPSITALLGGHVDCGAFLLPSMLPQSNARRLIPLAVALDQRNPIFPEVPTFKEMGHNLDNVALNYGLAAPRGTPPEIIQFYAVMFKKVSEDPEFTTPLKNMGQSVAYLGPQDFAQTVKTGFEEYGRLIRQLGIQP